MEIVLMSKLDERIYRVYKITNRQNNKSYIGITCYAVEERWRNHKNAAIGERLNFRFHFAIRKYGIHEWDINILEDDILGVKNAHEREKYYVSLYKTDLKAFGYNANSGGSGGWVVKDENYDEWKKNIIKSVSGENNPRYNGLTDEQLIELAAQSILDRNLNYIPGLPKVIEFSKIDGYSMPKAFSKFRFNGGGRKEFAKRLEEKTGLKYDPHWFKKTDDFKKLIRHSNELTRQKQRMDKND